MCNAHFSVTGTFAQSAQRPTDPETGAATTGCWPVGQWDFKAANSTELAMGDKPCAAPPDVLSSYSIKVEATTDSDGMILTATNLTSATGMQFHVSVAENGQGCVGSLEIGSADGKKYWHMQPTLSKDPAGKTLAGDGDYIEYSVDAWPWQDQ